MPMTLYPDLKVALKKPSIDICRLIVIRHCESTSNISNGAIRIAGRKYDVELTEEGRQQAAILAKNLVVIPGTVNVPVIYSSPMKRAIQTAECIKDTLGLFEAPIIKDERLHETWFAALEGANKKEYDPHGVRQKRELSELSSFQERMEYRLVEDMENLREVFERVSQCLLEISSHYLGETVIISTHNGPMKSLLIHLAEREKGFELLYDSFRVGNGAHLIIESDGSTLQLKAVEGINISDCQF